MSSFMGISKEPRYVQVYKALLASISSGEYEVGELLPPESALCDQFGVSRTTVREALRQLSEQDVVNKLHGIGTVVKNSQPRSNYIVAVNSPDTMQYGKKTALALLDRSIITTSAVHARLFSCAAGETWHLLKGLRAPAGDGEHPIALLEVYIPDRYAAIAQQPMRSDSPYYLRIAKQENFRTIGIEQEIQALAIDAGAAEVLRVLPHGPGLHVVRRFLAPDGQLMMASVNTHPSARFSYRFYLNQTTA